MGTSIDPAGYYNNITPSDTNYLKTAGGKTFRTKGISFGTAGALAIKDQDNITVVIPTGVLSAGIIHPIQTDRILSTGTTATNIVAYF